MKRTPNEMVNDYIDRMTDKAKESWNINGGSRYYEWEEMKSEWKDYTSNMEELANARICIHNLKQYLKENGRTEDFQEWISRKLN